jgi:hypothetical protein
MLLETTFQNFYYYKGIDRQKHTYYAATTFVLNGAKKGHEEIASMPLRRSLMHCLICRAPPRRLPPFCLPPSLFLPLFGEHIQ